jgi:hypothetical protein
MVVFCVVDRSLEICTKWIALHHVHAAVFFVTPRDKVAKQTIEGGCATLPALNSLIPPSKHRVVRLGNDHKRDLLACLPDICALLDEQFNLEQTRIDAMKSTPATKGKKKKQLEPVILFQCGDGVECALFAIVAYLMQKWRISASRAWDYADKNAEWTSLYNSEWPSFQELANLQSRQ